MYNYLLYLSGNDIPFKQAKLVIHQPKIKEIAYIGQDRFFAGCQLLTFSKNKISGQDRNNLESLNDFEILMAIIRNDDTVVKERKICMELVLTLLFPNYTLNFLPESIMLSQKNEKNQVERFLIDKNNFANFRQLLKIIFCLEDESFGVDQKYNVKGPQGRALVQKFRLRQKKLAKLKNANQKNQSISILSKYVSILAVGQNKNMNDLLQYTVYQLFDEFRRFRLKEDFDRFISFKLAGAKDIEEKDYWMIDLHSTL